MIDVLKPLIKQFLPFAQEKMGFERPPRLFLKQDSQNASNPLGKTAFYDPSAMSITLFVSERHPKDVMRSLSHELVHHTQNCNGDFENAGEMGEGYAQNNPHMREMEREAYDLGNMCLRDWEDSIKGTIYNESLQKGAKENMSTKNWKDKELNTLLLEKWGFKFDPDGLTEDEGAAGGELEPDEAKEEEDTGKKKGDRPYVSKEEEEGDLDEGFEKPKSATGSGPSNKAGKVDRSDVANKDTSKFGRGGSKGGGKPSASGTNAPPKGGKVDRSDVANKATGRWLKEEEELHESWTDEPEAQAGGAWGMGRGGGWTSERHPGGGKRYSGSRGRLKQKCRDMGCPGTHDTWWQNPARIAAAMPDCDIDMCNPDVLREDAGDLYEKHDEDWGMGKGEKSRTRPGEEDYTGHKGDESKTHPGEEDYEPEEGDVKDHAHRAMQAIHDLADAAGVTLDTEVSGPSDEDVEGEEWEEDELDERRGRGRADPRNQRGPADPRQRPMEEVRLREALKGRKITEEQMKQIVRKTLELRQERKTNKG